MKITDLYSEAVGLLKQLISTPSFSREERAAADIVQIFLADKGFASQRKNNNIWVRSRYFDTNKPTILLNSHLDTVKPSKAWTHDPFTPIVADGKLFGLGSNDAGASIVSLLAVFIFFAEQKDLPFNLIYAATAEEEDSGVNGIESITDDLGKIDLALIGEPTQMQMAIAEKGLMVLDCIAHGKAGHAGRNEGENAIYKAIKDIEWFQQYKFPKVSELIGAVKMSVTQISAGYQHNIVPDSCSFVVDVRTNELYSNKEIYKIIKEHVSCDVKALSFRLNSSHISIEHPIVQKGLKIGLTHFASPTTSDQAVLKYTSLKIGPGDSARSHSADEYIKLEEIKNGIETYIKLLDDLKIQSINI